MTQPPQPQQPSPSGASDDVKRRSARGGVYSIGMQAVQFAVATISTIVLARLLSPSIFGVFFMVLIVTELTSSFRDQGIPQAIARSDGMTDAVRSLIFRRNLRFNVLVSAGIIAVAPAVALVFGEARVIPLSAVLAVGLAVDGSANVHVGMLRHRLDFGTEATINAIALIVPTVAAVGVAVLGGGLWSLAVQHAGQHLLRPAMTFAAVRWRPDVADASEADRAVVSEVARFGRPLALSRLLVHGSRSVDRVVVGQVAGSAALGLYQTAYNWSVMPVRQITSPLLAVASTAMARVRDDVAKYRTWFSTGLLGICVICLPVIAGVATTAPALVTFLLGDEWFEAARLLRILAPAAATGLVTAALKWAYYAEGHTDRLLTWSGVLFPVTIAAVAVGSIWGSVGVAVAWSTTSVVMTLPEVRWCVGRSQLSAPDVWMPFGRTAVAALCGVAASVGVLGASPTGAASIVIGSMIVGATFIIVFLVLPGGRSAAGDLRRAVIALRSD